MQSGVVSVAELLAEPGAPLSADYWLNRNPGESWPAYQRRREADLLEARARTYEARARKLRKTARGLREGALS